MKTKAKELRRFAEAMLENATDLHNLGLMDTPTYEKITIRHLGALALPTSEPISGDDIRSLREKANLSQAALARFLNLTVGYVSQMERGVRKPSGPALTLLNVIRRKGFEAIL